MRMLAGHESNNNAKGKTLFVDMLNYGAAAQIRFSYAVTDLANKYLTEAQQDYATPEQKGQNNQKLGDGCLGVALALESRIEMTIVFNQAKVTKDMRAELTYTNFLGETEKIDIDGENFVAYGTSGWQFVLALPLVDGAELVTCTIYDGDEVVTMGQDSVEGYLSRQYTTHEIMPATWKFVQSAKAFFQN
jgi:hypothetical protein